MPTSKIDETFYSKYIGPPTEKNMHKMHNKFYAFLRYKDYMDNSIEDHERTFAYKMSNLFTTEESSITLYKSKVKEYYRMLIEGHKVLDSVFGKETQLTDKLFYEKTKSYLKTVDLKKLMAIYDFESESLETHTTSLCRFIKCILSRTFGLDITSENRGKKVGHGTKTIVSEFADIEVYAPRIFVKLLPANECIIDDC